MDFESKWYQQAAAISEKHKVSLSFEPCAVYCFLFVFCFVFCLFVFFVCFFFYFLIICWFPIKWSLLRHKFTQSLTSCGQHLSTPIWFWSIKTWLDSSPALSRKDSLGRGSCLWTSFDHIWMWPRQWGIFRFPREIQQSRWSHQRPHLSSTKCHTENSHQRCPIPSHDGAWYANLCSGPTLHPTTKGKPYGQPTLPSPLPHGRFHQWADLAHQLQTTPFQPSSIHQTHPLCGQQTHLWRLSPPTTSTLWSPSWRRLLWKAHHPGHGTWPRVSWFHAWNQACGAHLPRPHQHLPGPVTIFIFGVTMFIFGIPTKSSSQWLSFSLPHRRQGCFPQLPSPARPGSVNPLIYFGWFSHWGTPHHFIADFDSASKPSHDKIHWPFCRATFCFLLSSVFPLVVLVPVVFLPVPPASSSSVWLKLVPSICVGICFVCGHHGSFAWSWDSLPLGSCDHAAEHDCRLPSFLWTYSWLGWTSTWSIWSPTSRPSISQALAHFCPPSRFFLHSHSRIPWRATRSHDSESATSFTFYALFPYVVNLVPLRTIPLPATFIHSCQAFWTFCPYYCGHIVLHRFPNCKRFLVRRRPAQTETASYDHSNIFYDNQTPCQRGGSLPTSPPWHSSRRFQLRWLCWSNISWTSCIQSSTGFTTAREPKFAGEWYITTSNCRCHSDPSIRQVQHGSTTSYSGNHCPAGPSFPSL